MKSSPKEVLLILAFILSSIFFLVPNKTYAIITFVSSTNAVGASITPAAHNVGDLIVIYAYRYSNATPATLSTGYTNILGGGNANVSVRAAWVIATTTGGSSAWANATGMMALVYRGAAGIGAATSSAALSGTTCMYPSISASSSVQTSWIVRLATRASMDSLLQTNLPNSMTLRNANASSTAPFQIAVDTNGPMLATEATSTVSCGSANSAYVTDSFELVQKVARRMRIFQGYRMKIIDGRIKLYQS